MPIHRAFVDEKAYLASIGKELDEGGKKGNDFLKDCTKDCMKQLTERQSIIINNILLSATITIPEIARKTGVSERTIKTDIADLQAKGILTREGGRKDGRWVITQSWKILLLYGAIIVNFYMLQTTMSKKEKIRKRLSFLSGNTFSIQVSNAQYADLNVIPIAYAIRVMPTGFTKPE